MRNSKMFSARKFSWVETKAAAISVARYCLRFSKVSCVKDGNQVDKKFQCVF